MLLKIIEEYSIELCDYTHRTSVLMKIQMESLTMMDI